MISKDNIVVSFITINYNSSVYTIELIKSIEKYTSLKTMYEIIIVDNASDNSDYIKLKEYANANKRVQLIKNEENEGFSRWYCLYLSTSCIALTAAKYSSLPSRSTVTFRGDAP